MKVKVEVHDYDDNDHDYVDFMHTYVTSDPAASRDVAPAIQHTLSKRTR